MVSCEIKMIKYLIKIAIVLGLGYLIFANPEAFGELISRIVDGFNKAKN